MPPYAAVLFDRDGTLIKDKHYLADPAGVELLPHVGEALQALAREGSRLFVVSNQSGVGRGLFPLSSVFACNARLAELLSAYGATLEDMVFCPHAPEEHCACRKPAPGMWLRLVETHALEVSRTVMVGDKAEDMLFAANAGLAARILTLTGKGRGTAEALGLAIGPAPFLGLYPQPASPAHPHACVSDFSLLGEALERLAALKGSPCAA
jgi:D-glycero-D-manno-heptose 1,7-bisphosphate phosphatase